MTQSVLEYDRGFRRLLAYGVDTCVLLAVTELFLLLFRTFAGGGAEAALFLSTIAQLFYYTFFVAGRLQATPGALLLRIRVVTESGGRPSLTQAFVRIASQLLLVALLYKLGFPTDVSSAEEIERLTPQQKYVIWIGMAAMLGWYVPALFTRQHTAAHDLLSRTRVTVVRPEQ
jgi:uncharacterized RDD family membrane protein YckC